ncbi:MAG: RagB/SusD family nutrient uptake outer membrane protein [Cyclobacteriaceae bacterium]
MKYLNKILLLSLSLLALNCADLEEDAIGTLSSDGFFKTPVDVEMGIFGAYGLMTQETFWGRKMSLTIQLLGDMADIGNTSTSARRVEINEFNFDGTNGMITAFWPAAYNIIATANNAVFGAQNISADADVKLALEAEARFVRAFVYYHMVRLFGDIPYVSEKTPANVMATLSKSSEEDVYQYIADDLEFAKQHLPMTHPGNIRSRATRGSAYTLLASVYLTIEDWQNAYDNAKWVIDNRGELNYDLVADYQDLFNSALQDGQVETVFSLDYKGIIVGKAGINDDFMGALNGIRGADKNGWGVSVPSMAVYNSFPDDDYRKAVTFESETLIDGVLVPYDQYPNEQRPHCAKYFRFYGEAQNEGRKTDNNYAMFRYAEVLLIAAEALNEISGPTAEAQGYVNQVRGRARNGAATPADVSTTEAADANAFRETVLEERRIELAFEFKRWYDIKRRKLGDEVFLGTNSLEPQPNFDASKHYYLPLKQAELDRNPNLLPQNAGYD